MKRRVRLMKQPTSRRRGAMLILIACLMLVFVGIVAFSVDVAYMQLSRTELQTATDASARAAGAALTRTQNVNQARQEGIDLALLNTVDGKSLILENGDVLAGYSQRQANGKWQFTAGGSPVNSFRITGRKLNNSPSGSVGLFFGAVFGKRDFELTRTASAVRMDRDVAIVVDRSSSMKLYTDESGGAISSGDWRFCTIPQPRSRWAALSEAVRVFVQDLGSGPQDLRVGLISYASDGTWCSVTNKRVTVDQDLATNLGLVVSGMNVISGTNFNGMTDIAAGIDTGVTQLTTASNARPFAQKTIVLMTDGVQTAGRSPLDAARDAANAGCIIYTVTFGDDADQDTMRQVAQITGGKHYHAPDEATLIEAFREIASTLTVTLTE